MKKKQSIIKDNFIRAIIVDRILDWDTIHINCDLWFDIRKKMKVRLARINCPEKNTEEWIKVKEYMKKYEWNIGVIESLKYDKYGRWLCEVYIEWNNISDELLSMKYAFVRDWKWEKPVS